MSKKDATKSSINVLLALMVVFLSALLGIIGWVFVRYEELSLFKLIGAISGGCFLLGIFCAFAFSIYRQAQKIGENEMIGGILALTLLFCTGVAVLFFAYLITAKS
ncbi:hypothetical protein [Helicobacter sp. MIT 01-3238]|nr:hypothetical protein [Helicobacter sp. MIT 01-3238]RDU51254.1 hypothetical protein CQA40_10730 [Helicobacter sp. MIT 01-3238]